MIATSPSGKTLPATTMSKTASCKSGHFGNATQCPSINATLTPPTGPENGNPAS